MQSLAMMRDDDEQIGLDDCWKFTVVEACLARVFTDVLRCSGMCLVATYATADST
jgi:hypothetical protein